jgi:hypothetical protein
VDSWKDCSVARTRPPRLKGACPVILLTILLGGTDPHRQTSVRDSDVPGRTRRWKNPEWEIPRVPMSASALHFKPMNFSLQSFGRENLAERNQIALAEEARKDAAKFGLGRVTEPEFRNCKTRSFQPAREKWRSSRHSQNNRGQHPPRFVMRRPSKASLAGTLNSVMILFRHCGSLVAS